MSGSCMVPVWSCMVPVWLCVLFCVVACALCAVVGARVGFEVHTKEDTEARYRMIQMAEPECSRVERSHKDRDRGGNDTKRYKRVIGSARLTGIDVRPLTATLSVRVRGRGGKTSALSLLARNEPIRIVIGIPRDTY